MNTFLVCSRGVQHQVQAAGHERRLAPVRHASVALLPAARPSGSMVLWMNVLPIEPPSTSRPPPTIRLICAKVSPIDMVDRSWIHPASGCPPDAPCLQDSASISLDSGS